MIYISLVQEASINSTHCLVYSVVPIFFKYVLSTPFTDSVTLTHTTSWTAQRGFSPETQLYLHIQRQYSRQYQSRNVFGEAICSKIRDLLNLSDHTAQTSRGTEQNFRILKISGMRTSNNTSNINSNNYS